MDYLILKHIHMSCAAISGSLFVLRGIWMMQSSARLQARWVKILPHLVDTALLASAISLALISHQYPFAQNWLSAKLLALIAYIVLGTVALKRGPTQKIRTLAWLAALLVFAYIIAVAFSKSVLPFFS